MHVRSLPLSHRCRAYDRARDGEQCRRCDLRVHDLSARTESEATDLLARAGTQRTCVSYRVRHDGTVVFRPSRVASGARLGVLAAALTGCTPILESADLEPPDETCRDERDAWCGELDDEVGYRTIPDEVAAPAPAPTPTPPRARAPAPAPGPVPAPDHDSTTIYEFSDDEIVGVFLAPVPVDR